MSHTDVIDPLLLRINFGTKPNITKKLIYIILIVQGTNIFPSSAYKGCGVRCIVVGCSEAKMKEKSNLPADLYLHSRQTKI